MRRCFAWILASLVIFPGVLHPATIRVPEDQPTIAAGLAVAVSGDEVVLSCGTYLEGNLRVKPGVFLRSETGLPECALIDGHNVLARVIGFHGADNTRLEGVTIRGGTRGGGSITSSSNVTIQRCKFTENSIPGLQTVGAALNMFNSDVSILETDFVENGAGRTNANVIRARGGALQISDCNFTYNSSSVGYGFACLILDEGGPVSIRSSRFVDNGWVLDVHDRTCSIANSTFESNHGNYWHYGGGTFLFGSSNVELFRCVFRSNDGSGNDGIWRGPTYAFYSCPSVTIESCVFHGEGSPSALLGGVVETGSVRRTIFSEIAAPRLFDCNMSVSCSDFWANDGPLFGSGCEWDTTGILFADPMFCNAELGDYHVARASPCMPTHSPCGQLIGVLGEGCGPVSLKAQSWGGIKNLYR